MDFGAEDRAVRGLSGELELQARWFAGEFGRQFRGTEGESVEIVQFGVWNRSAGPDFVEAAVSIQGAAPVRGAVEIDPDVRDWERHGHGANPSYEEVVLHVFQTSPPGRFFSRTATHRMVPQVHLPSIKNERPPSGVLAHAGRCAPVLAVLPMEQLRLTLCEAARWRFERKAALLAQTAEVHGWNESLFQSLATGMGYPNNQLPFRLLSQRVPLRKLIPNPAAAEALLFGVAGFMPAPDLSPLPPGSRGHARQLWEHWWQYRASHQALEIPRSIWRLNGQRPANHPMRRLGALAVLLRHWRTLRRLVQEADWKRLRTFLGGLQHPYWSHHYSFASGPSPRPIALLGDERINELLANSLLPLAGDWETLLKMPAGSLNQRNRVAAARLLAKHAEARKLLRKTVFQQGLLELYEQFCSKDASDCRDCPFPEHPRAEEVCE